MVKVLDKLCCLNLHSAGLVIGWFSLIGSVLSLISLALIYLCPDKFFSVLLSLWQSAAINSKYQDTTNLLMSPLGSKISVKFISWYYNSEIFLLCFTFIVAAISNIVVSCMLINSRKKKCSSRILPWLIVHGLCIVLVTFLLSCCAYYMFVGEIRFTSYFLFALIGFVVYCCIYMVIYSLYKNIQTTENNISVANNCLQMANVTL